MHRRFAVVCSMLLVLAACGSDSSEETASPTTTSVAVATTEPPPTTQAPTPTTAAPTTTLPIPCTVSEQASVEETEPGRLLEEILDRGVVRVGVLPLDAPPLFSCLGGEYVGFEAAIARLLVEGVIGPIEIAWVPLASADRFDAVREGGVDLVVRNTTVTPDREDLVEFTTPYLMDGPAVIVPLAAGVTDLAGLEGLRIAVRAGSQFEEDLNRILGELGVAFELVPAESPDEFVPLLESGEADAYAASWLQGVVAANVDHELEVIPLEFNSGIAAFASPSESEFAAALSEQMQALIDGGAWASEFTASFEFAPPWTLEEMAARG